MAITLAENVTLFTAIKNRINRRGAAAACNAAAEDYYHIVHGLLSRPGRAASGMPPGLETGELRSSLALSRAVSGFIHASATVAPSAVYAGVQEFGGYIYAKNYPYMKWQDLGRTWRKPVVHIREHSYMRAGVRIGIASGSMTAAAAGAFLKVESL